MYDFLWVPYFILFRFVILGEDLGEIEEKDPNEMQDIAPDSLLNGKNISKCILLESVFLIAVCWSSHNAIHNIDAD